MYKKNVGRPLKVDYKVIEKLDDALRHRATITEAAKHANISRTTYYKYLNTHEMFAKRMRAAQKSKAILGYVFF